PAAPERPAVPNNTLARTGNTADHQAGWFAGMEQGQADAQANMAIRAPSRDWKTIQVAIDDYLDGYELRADEGAHTPTDFERFLLDDCIAGLLAEDDILALLAGATAPAAGDAHPDDIAVDRFAVAMKAKLAKKRAEGRSGWDDKQKCGASHLSEMLYRHVAEGNPVDVGNLAMMLHQRGEAIMPASSHALELKRKTDLVAELSKIIHNMTVAQQAAWIEWQHGAGAEAGMQWIENGLAGPGQIPDADEPYGTEAQAYFDANQADPLPVCHCGRPSNILHMGNGYCSNEHYRAAIAAQRKGRE
ncbi:hypothetical protein L7A40_19140, partial [Achromobacter xylosoxidans]